MGVGRIAQGLERLCHTVRDERARELLAGERGWARTRAHIDALVPE
jgi:hypothetical protein